MRLVGRMARKVASKLDLAAIVARRKELRPNPVTVVETPVVEPTAVEAPIVEIIEEKVDFLEMEVDPRVVLEGAWIARITEDNSSFGDVLYACKKGAYENYERLFRHIDLADEELKRNWSYPPYPDSLVNQYERWKNNIRRYVEGDYCRVCWERDWKRFQQIEKRPDQYRTKIDGNDILCEGCNSLMGWVKFPNQ